MTPFTYNSRAARIVFGAGSLERLGEQLDELGIRRGLVLSTPEQRFLADRVRKLGGERCVGIFDGAVMHVPVATAQAGVDAARTAAADGLIAAGGGSTLGLAKAIALETSLPIVAVPTTYAGSEVAQYGAWLCGTVLGSVGMALHHKLCHTLGGAFNLPHAETHSVILPYAMAFNLPAAPDATRRLRRALGTPDPATSLYELGRKLGAPASLETLGLKAGDLDRAAEIAMRSPCWNPRPLSYGAVRRLLQLTFDGVCPDLTSFDGF
jgi:maleylacetate reductase